MNCQDIQKFAFTYLDAEFDARERGEFEEHLKLCSPCRLTVHRDAMMKDVVARHLRTNSGADCNHVALRGKICASLERVQRRKLQQSIGVGVAVAASVVAVIAVGQAVPGDHGASRGDALARSQPVTLAPRSAAAVPVPQPLPGFVPVGARPTELAVARAPVAARAAEPHLPGLEPSNIQRVSARMEGSAAAADAGEVLRGALRPGAMVERSPFGAVRSEDSLRQIVQVHMADPPAEISGPPARIQRYLQSRLPGVGSLPLAEGAGLELRGARIAVLGGQLVVIYSYAAYGSPLTVVSRAKAHGDEPDVESLGPDHQGPSGVMLDRRSGLHLLHVVEQNRVLTLVGELGAPAMMQLLPSGVLL